MTSEVTTILDDLRRVVRVLRESSREAERRLGVSGAQLFVLRVLASSNAVSLSTLAARTRTHQSSVSAVVTRLVDAGFVERTPSPEDARRVEVVLTRRGRKLLVRAPFAAQDRLIEGVERLSRDERSQLALSMRRLVVAMGLEADEPRMFFDEDVSHHATRGSSDP